MGGPNRLPGRSTSLSEHIILAGPDISANVLRGLAIDAVEEANSGHPGGPMGLAAVGWNIFTSHLRHSPSNPGWRGRDRFVLSNGHASTLIYSLLHLTGYELTTDDLRAFRQFGSKTPGHPERGDTPGVEITTGPLGQGMANAVGFALAERMLAERFNRDDHEVVDHRTWFICSDGDLMEGISYEAASLAGFLGLGKLVGVYDDNRISLDGPTSLTFGEDVAARFSAAGWRVLNVADGNDAGELETVLGEAANSDGRPTMVIARTHIGFGAPTKQDSASAHGSPLGADEAAGAKAALGLSGESFDVPPEVAAWAEEMVDRGLRHEVEWGKRMEAYQAAFPREAAELERVLSGELPSGWADALPDFGPDEDPVATRKASGSVINALAGVLPEIVQGAADLSVSTNTTINGSRDIAPGEFSGRNIRFGVREHAMGAMVNALAAHGGFRPVCSTFLTFSDYLKNTIRLAALMDLPSIFVFTHDSIALGEDGPTHQPVEHLAGLRAIPGLVVLRPADAAETAGAWKVAIERQHGPTALVLTRQSLAPLPGDPDVARGAWVVAEGDDCILIASGSEVGVALEARTLLAGQGIGARVVSMPSHELFASQSEGYRESVLPSDVRARVAVEAAAPEGWHRWAGIDGAVVALERFGASAPGPEVMERLGITGEAVADAARTVLGR